MTVVLPIWQDRISPVLDYAGRFLVVEYDGARETGRREVLVGETHLSGLVNGIQELGGDVLLCGALSRPLEDRLRRKGLPVVSHVCGGVDAVLQAFCRGTLEAPEFALPGCWGRRRRRRCCWRGEPSSAAWPTGPERTGQKELRIMRIAITAQGTGLEAGVDAHFGRASYLVTVDAESGEVGAIDNRDSQQAMQGAGVQTARRLADAGIQAVVSGQVGPKAMTALRTAGIEVYSVAGGTVGEALEAFKTGRLRPTAAPDALGAAK